MDLGGMLARTASTQVFHQRWKNFGERLCPPEGACGHSGLSGSAAIPPWIRNSSASEMPRSLRFLLVIQLPFWPACPARQRSTPPGHGFRSVLMSR